MDQRRHSVGEKQFKDIFMCLYFNFLFISLTFLLCERQTNTETTNCKSTT